MGDWFRRTFRIRREFHRHSSFSTIALALLPILAGSTRLDSLAQDKPGSQPPGVGTSFVPTEQSGYGLDLFRSPTAPFVKELLRREDRLNKIEPFKLGEKAPGKTGVVDGKELPSPTERVKELETYKMNLADARRAALEHQLEIKAELILPAIAQQQVREAQSRFEAVVFGRISRGETDAREPSPLTTEDKATVGLQIPLRTGGSASISLPVLRQWLSPTPPGAPPHYYSLDPAVTLSQPLLKGAGLRINHASINRARLLSEQSQARAKLLINNLLANVDRAYWRLWSARREIDVRYEQYEMAQRQLRSAEKLVEAGIVPKLEIVRSQVGLSQRVNTMIISETTRRAIEREIKRILNLPGLDLTSDTALLPATEPELFPFSINRSNLIAHALKERMDLLMSQIQVAVDLVDKDVARNQVLPDLTVDFQYSANSLGTTFKNGVDAFDDAQKTVWGTGLTLSIPIGNQGAKARLRQSVLRHASSLNSLEQRRRIITQEVLDAVDRLSQSWQLIQAAVREIELAQSIYQGELKQFESGMRTSTEVLDAAQFVANAQIRHVQAIADYEISKVEVAYATGTQLGYAQVEIPAFSTSSSAGPSPSPSASPSR